MIRFAVLANQDEITACASLPVEEDVAAQSDIPAAGVDIVSAVAVFNDDKAAGVIVINPATAGEVVEENVILDDYGRDAVDVDVFVAAGLVVEEVALDGDMMGTIVNLQDVVVIAVVQDVVANDDMAHAAVAATIDMEYQSPRTGTAVADLKTFDGDATHAASMGIGGQHPVVML